MLASGFFEQVCETFGDCGEWELVRCCVGAEKEEYVVSVRAGCFFAGDIGPVRFAGHVWMVKALQVRFSGGFGVGRTFKRQCWKWLSAAVEALIRYATLPKGKPGTFMEEPR